MSGASFQKFFLLIIIGLVVLGPKRLPQVANQIGSWLGQARRMTRMMKRQLEDEINLDLDSLNVQKQLGLDGSSAAPKKPSVSSPSYVHDQKPADTGARPGEKVFDKPSDDVADSPDEDENENELPDDYSPAHAADEPGTGVNDAEPEDSLPQEDSLAADDDRDEEDAAADTPAEKKEAG